ncbi:MAG: hypothetical protein ACW976_03050 [Candidatus Ranarchaeia archaeon]|jgi:hypothetical protein
MLGAFLIGIIMSFPLKQQTRKNQDALTLSFIIMLFCAIFWYLLIMWVPLFPFPWMITYTFGGGDLWIGWGYSVLFFGPFPVFASSSEIIGGTILPGILFVSCVLGWYITDRSWQYLFPSSSDPKEKPPRTIKDPCEVCSERSATMTTKDGQRVCTLCFARFKTPHMKIKTPPTPASYKEVPGWVIPLVIFILAFSLIAFPPLFYIIFLSLIMIAPFLVCIFFTLICAMSVTSETPSEDTPSSESVIPKPLPPKPTPPPPPLVQIPLPLPKPPSDPRKTFLITSYVLQLMCFVIFAFGTGWIASDLGFLFHFPISSLALLVTVFGFVGVLISGGLSRRFTKKPKQ